MMLQRVSDVEALFETQLFILEGSRIGHACHGGKPSEPELRTRIRDTAVLTMNKVDVVAIVK